MWKVNRTCYRITRVPLLHIRQRFVRFLTLKINFPYTETFRLQFFSHPKYFEQQELSKTWSRGNEAKKKKTSKSFNCACVPGSNLIDFMLGPDVSLIFNKTKIILFDIIILIVSSLCKFLSGSKAWISFLKVFLVEKRIKKKLLFFSGRKFP